jgi:hypothetical protein
VIGPPVRIAFNSNVCGVKTLKCAPIETPIWHHFPTVNAWTGQLPKAAVPCRHQKRMILHLVMEMSKPYARDIQHACHVKKIQVADGVIMEMGPELGSAVLEEQKALLLQKRKVIMDMAMSKNG